MIGTIASFNRASTSGVIRSQAGDSVPFDAAAVLAYDISGLTVGQQVIFETEGRAAQRAINIQTLRRLPLTEGKHDEMAELRYMGFESQGDARIYRFERLSRGEDKQTFALKIDMLLFRKYHVTIQEGPALCLWLLGTELKMEAASQLQLPGAITDQYMSAWVATKPLPGSKSGRRSAARTPTETSHHA